MKFCTLKECCRTKQTSGRKEYEINRRKKNFFRENGQGYVSRAAVGGMNTFCIVGWTCHREW